MSDGKPQPEESDDVAPGAMESAGHTIRAGVQGYLIGLGLAVLLTVASFYIAGSGFIWGPSIPVALAVLAVAQIGVHLTFFLHITTAPDNTNNILALAFGVLIVTLVVGGSIWIMGHMNQNMLPMDQMMQMRR
ncbi:MAG: cytochrome o ubiquinol oxidase subunit IV [Acetobacteraceae bacterium]|nr:cytochrome o ubiquinol oxidase subunit IV [Pseudomonadota bacterium]